MAESTCLRWLRFSRIDMRQRRHLAVKVAPVETREIFRLRINRVRGLYAAYRWQRRPIRGLTVGLRCRRTPGKMAVRGSTGQPSPHGGNSGGKSGAGRAKQCDLERVPELHLDDAPSARILMGISPRQSLSSPARRI
jgi:hypothetical protein